MMALDSYPASRARTKHPAGITAGAALPLTLRVTLPRIEGSRTPHPRIEGGRIPLDRIDGVELGAQPDHETALRVGTRDGLGNAAAADLLYDHLFWGRAAILHQDLPGHLSGDLQMAGPLSDERRKPDCGYSSHDEGKFGAKG
jgi:hypothetical protein